MNRSKIIAISLLLSFRLAAQLLVPDHTTVFKKELNFHPDYIKQNQIKKVVFEILDKKDFETAVDKHLVEHYEFSNSGYLSRFYYTDIIKTIEKQVAVSAPVKGKKKGKRSYSYTVNDYVYDTISTTHIYDEANKILMKRNHLGYGFYDTHYYHYDSTYKLVQDERYKETNVSQAKSDFILGNQVKVSADSMKVITYGPDQTKVIYYNNERRPYKEQFINSKNGKVVNISESYVAASWIQQTQEFEYNESGQLTKAIFKGNANTNLTYLHTYEYDKKGWLLTDKHWKNDVLLSETSFVNDFNSNLVNSIVIRDFVNKSIRIIKLKYAYFDSIQVKNH